MSSPSASGCSTPASARPKTGNVVPFASKLRTEYNGQQVGVAMGAGDDDAPPPAAPDRGIHLLPRSVGVRMQRTGVRAGTAPIRIDKPQGYS